MHKQDNTYRNRVGVSISIIMRSLPTNVQRELQWFLRGSAPTTPGHEDCQGKEDKKGRKKNRKKESCYLFCARTKVAEKRTRRRRRRRTKRTRIRSTRSLRLRIHRSANTRLDMSMATKTSTLVQDTRTETSGAQEQQQYPPFFLLPCTSRSVSQRGHLIT